MLSFLKVLLKALFLLTVIGFWFIISCYIWIEYTPPFIKDPFADTHKSYDYIIVGAGSAGSVIAMRLAEDPNASVLLLEAGPEGGRLLDVPALLPLLQLSPIDWSYKTVPQEHSNRGMKDRVCNWPRGRIVGGTGRFNNMIYLRGDKRNFDEWYKDKEDYVYEKDVLNYFKKSENQQGCFKGDKKHHSSDGPLNADDVPFMTELSSAFLEAAKYLGFPVRDLNGQHSTGFMVPQANLQNGARYSTGHYLIDNKPKNLHLLTNVHAEKILFKGNFEAHAIKCTKYGIKRTIKAKKALVLSAGSIDTPKLLLLSGIGPKADLEQLNIKNIANLPVGRNLQDHITTGVDLFTVNSPLAMSPNTMLAPSSILSYLEGKGPWTSIQCEAIGVLHANCINSKNFTDCTDQQTTSPDFQIMALPLGFVSDNGAHLRNIIGITDETWSYVEPLVGSPTITLLPILLRPKSRGFMKLKDKDPSSKPIIDPKYLSHGDDVKILVKGIEALKKFIAAPSMQKLGVSMYKAPFPGCENFAFDSSEYWECYVKHLTLTVYHPVGTAKMGIDPESVVGFDFKVHGTNKLFVGDASVFPSITSANTNAATVMIAEKVADSIKEFARGSVMVCHRKEVFFLQD